MKYTFDNITVYPLDLAKLRTHFSLEVGEYAAVKTFTGLILEPKPTLIDTEIVTSGCDLDGKVSLDIWKDPPADANGRLSIPMCPSWQTKITPEALKDEYTLEPVTLAEFVADRRGYNSRLKANERAVTEWFNEG